MSVQPIIALYGEMKRIPRELTWEPQAMAIPPTANGYHLKTESRQAPPQFARRPMSGGDDRGGMVTIMITQRSTTCQNGDELSSNPDRGGQSTWG